MHTDTATITTFTNNEVDKNGKVTQKKVIHEAIPCRLSFKSVTAATDGVIPNVSQAVTMFVAPNVEIVPGSQVDITRDGVTYHYTASGAVARYASHLEIGLERRDVHGTSKT